MLELGRRRRQPLQGEVFAPSGDLPRTKGHPLTSRLNDLRRANFDDYLEE